MVLRATAAKASATVPPTPAMNEPIAAMLSAAPARPRRANWWPSTAVMTLDDSPGTLIKTEVIVPPYMPP